MNQQLKHPEMTLAPDYDMPSGRVMRKTMRQIAYEAQWRAARPARLAKKAGAYFMLALRLIGLLTFILVGALLDTLGSILTQGADAMERLCNRITKTAPPPPWKR
jgi:hypothetical protein